MNLFRSRIVIAFALCATVCLAGTVGYMMLEKYTFGEGLYMSAITMSTVGFGEVRPLSDDGRTFTVALILMSFISLAFAGHTLGESMLEKVWGGQAGKRKMLKRIATFKNHYIICGFGRVGAAAVAHFEKIGVDFVIIEANTARRAALLDKGFLFIEGDATHEDVLAEAGIKKAKGLLAMLDSDPDNLFIVLTAREMNPTLKILSRAGDASSGHKIIRAGADDVVSPLATAGTQIANEMLKTTGHQTVPDGRAKGAVGMPQWIDISLDADMIGRSIEAWSDKFGINVIGLRSRGKDIICPDGKTTLCKGDRIFVLKEQADNKPSEKKPGNNHHKRIVIVDDSPVITKLYTRLFQKAGFTPLPTINGKEGLDLILQEKPHAAVIDYRLPDMSGIDVCKEVRRQIDDHAISLILFTADDSAETSQNAIAAGADAVVVKSPEASEVIRTVIDILENKA